MVGGIIERVDEYADRTTVLVRGTGTESGDLLAIDLEPTAKTEATVLRPALLLRKGDGIWWQSHVAYWTPADKVFQDVPIERIGYSSRV